MKECILSVDAASSKVGFAVMTSADTLLDCGLIIQEGTDTFERIEAICKEIKETVERVKKEFGVKRAVLEITSGHQHRRLRGRTQGMQTLGAGIHAVRKTLLDCGLEVIPIKENEWTRGLKKDKRAQYVTMLFPRVDFSADKGFDVRDAIGVLRYWFAKQEVLRGT